MNKRKIQFLFVVLILTIFILLFLYVVFGYFEKRVFCLNVQDEYGCIVDRAIQDKDPSHCWYLDAGSSDRCSEEVLRAVPDVALCKKIPQWGIRRDCYNSFKK